MNREQWLRKRSHVEPAGTPPAFGAANFAGLTHPMETPGNSSQTFAAIRQQHFDDGLACDEWSMVGPDLDDSSTGSH